MKTFLRRAALAASVLVIPSTALAAINITADNGAVWQTNKIGDTTQGFLQIQNTGDTADVLTAWDCPIATTTTLVGGDGKPLQNLTIPPGQTVAMTSNGPHLMLLNTHFTVEFGSLVPCALTFQNAGQIGVYLNAVPAP
jgi:copper(I)-binding protein